LETLIRTEMKGGMDTKQGEDLLGQSLKANDKNPRLQSLQMSRGRSTTTREEVMMVIVAMAWRSQIFDAKPQV
jgi:hypothetical protein